MIDMLRALMRKVDNMKVQIINIRREIEALRKNPQEIPEIKYTQTERRMSLMGSQVDWTW